MHALVLFLSTQPDMAIPALIDIYYITLLFTSLNWKRVEYFMHRMYYILGGGGGGGGGGQPGIS